MKTHKAESGVVRGYVNTGLVQWTMSADEAEEIADYIERSSEPHDVARVDVEAIRKAIADARGTAEAHRVKGLARL